MIHVTEPDRDLRHSLHRSENLFPVVTVEADAKLYLVGRRAGGRGPVWRLELTEALLDHLSELVPPPPGPNRGPAPLARASTAGPRSPRGGSAA